MYKNGPLGTTTGKKGLYEGGVYLVQLYLLLRDPSFAKKKLTTTVPPALKERPRELAQPFMGSRLKSKYLNHIHKIHSFPMLNATLRSGGSKGDVAENLCCCPQGSRTTKPCRGAIDWAGENCKKMG